MPNRPGRIWRQENHPHPAVKGSKPLSVFMERFRKKKRGKLSKADRLRIVGQALVLLERNYVHLPLKRAMHAVDPVQRLRLIGSRIEDTDEQKLPDEMSFHQDMQRLFTSTRDFHTSYRLPAPFGRHTAYLPFLIEEYFEKVNGIVDAEEPKFLVSKLATGFEHETFKLGVEVLYWNGTPIKRAIEINGETQAGSNIEARFACGLDSLTIRPLHSSLPPDEEWVVVTYRSLDGRKLDLKQKWLVFAPRPGQLLAEEIFAGKSLGIDIKKASVNEARKILFVSEAPRPTGEFEQIGPGIEKKRLETHVDAFLASVIRTRSGREFGYIRVFNFETENTDEFVREFKRLVQRLPPDGLIIDVRNNGGGIVNAGERLLQLLTPHPIKPELFELINTPLNLELSRLDEDLQEWTKSLLEAVETGATYSLGFPLTDEESCNRIGQRYFGPVVLIIDALCYSTTDMFAAGFADHEIGTVMGVSGNTGAGGANVWEHGDLRDSMSHHADSPYKPLPKGVGMRVAFRRSIRVGKEAGGRPLEDLGVVPDPRNRHYMTKDDLLHDNRDLIRRAARVLASKRSHKLEARVYYRRDGTLFITPRTRNISRLDVYINDRPRRSFDVEKPERRFTVKVSHRGMVLLEGYDGARLVAVRRKRF